MNALDARSSVLVLIDYQARLMPAISDSTGIVANAALLGKSARMLGIPVLGTEQNPSGLGHLVHQVNAECARILPKTHFDACSDGLVDLVRETSEDAADIVVAGCEAHVCVAQTALGLLRAGKRVWLVADASGSRRPEDHAAAMSRLGQAGATVVTREMVIFEWLGHCKHPRFRDVLGLVKTSP